MSTPSSPRRPERATRALALILGLVSGCESAKDVGEQAGIEYIVPFIGAAEAQTAGCDAQIELAKTMHDKGKAKRAELKAKVEKVKGDDAFENALRGFTDQIGRSTLKRFPEACPSQAAELTKIAAQTAEELAIGDIVPPWPPAPGG